MRLIDADRVLEQNFYTLKNYSKEEAGAWREGIALVKEKIINAPTIDPETLRPVARWVDANDTENRPQHKGTYIVSLSNMFGTVAENAIAKYDDAYDEWVLCDSRKTVFHADTNGYYSNSMNAELTHWMEQPKPPKEDEK